MDHVTALPGSTKCDEKLPAWPNLPTTGPFFFSQDRRQFQSNRVMLVTETVGRPFGKLSPCGRKLQTDGRSSWAVWRRQGSPPGNSATVLGQRLLLLNSVRPKRVLQIQQALWSGTWLSLPGSPVSLVDSREGSEIVKTVGDV